MRRGTVASLRGRNETENTLDNVCVAPAMARLAAAFVQTRKSGRGMENTPAVNR
ncbi:hypothetical protein OH686_16595 [Pseudomonas sp. SO81]|nr:hypothetical protein OH686_16595 [Pseudomonas sp. SO81]